MDIISPLISFTCNVVGKQYLRKINNNQELLIFKPCPIKLQISIVVLSPK